MPLDGFQPISLKYPMLTMGEDECRWPYGEPGEEGFHFCRRETVLGRSYCALHQEVAYIPKEERLSTLKLRNKEVSENLRRIQAEEEKKQNGR